LGAFFKTIVVMNLCAEILFLCVFHINKNISQKRNCEISLHLVFSRNLKEYFRFKRSTGTGLSVPDLYCGLREKCLENIRNGTEASYENIPQQYSLQVMPVNVRATPDAGLLQIFCHAGNLLQVFDVIVVAIATRYSCSSNLGPVLACYLKVALVGTMQLGKEVEERGGGRDCRVGAGRHYIYTK
jgi:hypothetical protein